MSLATRCSACGTVFRVVQDQLKISEGWVRCGRCKEVFNALEGLFDLERESPPEWRPRAQAATRGELENPVATVPPLSFPSISAPDEPEAPAPSRFDRSADIDLPIDPAAHEEPFVEPPWAVSALPSSFGKDALADDADRLQHGQSPAFLRETGRGRPRLPALDSMWAAAIVLLVLLLAVQASYRNRDALAADWPWTRPLLAGLCSWTGCRIEAPHRIEDIAVESSTLTRADTNPDSDAMRLSIVLRNRGAAAVAMPTIELSLTDTNGELVARRALSSADFHVADTTLPPAVETTLQLLMSTSGRRVSGYTVEVFYP